MATGVGARIRQARNALGWTQDDLASRMGKTKSLISKVENGLDNLTSDKIREYANILGVSTAYLMGWDDSLNDSNRNNYILFEDIVLSMGYEIWDFEDPTNNSMPDVCRMDWRLVSPKNTLSICSRNYRNELVIEKNFTFEEIKKIAAEFHKISTDFIKQTLSGNNMGSDISSFERNVIYAYRAAHPVTQKNICSMLGIEQSEHLNEE